MRWPRYSEHPWLQRFRVMAVVAGLVCGVIAFIILTFGQR